MATKDKKNTDKKPAAKKPAAKKDTAKKPAKNPAKKPEAKREVLEPEVISKDEGSKAFQVSLRNNTYVGPLASVESCIKRDIDLMSRHEQAAAMVSIRIGLGLVAAKEMVKSKTYGAWLDNTFGESFSKRKAQYCSKLAKVFLDSDESKTLVMPETQEKGNWLIMRDDGSDLADSVSNFIGDQTLAELYDKYKIKPTSTKGGFRPASWLLKIYVEEHPELKNRPFDIWAQSEKEKYVEWQGKHTEGDNTASKRLAAEQSFEGIRLMVSNHCLTRKSHSLIDKSQAQVIYDVLTDAAAEIKKTHNL